MKQDKTKKINSKPLFHEFCTRKRVFFQNSDQPAPKLKLSACEITSQVKNLMQYSLTALVKVTLLESNSCDVVISNNSRKSTSKKKN